MPPSSAAGDAGAVEAVAAHVLRVPLPLPLPDLKTVNAYVIVDSGSLTLIDPGWASPESEQALLGVLGDLGASPRDVGRILVTHQHWDHYSLGVRWRDTYGIELMLGREERHSIEAFTGLAGVHPVQAGMLIEAGAADLAGEIAALEWEPYEQGVAFSSPDRWLTEGEVIDCGSAQLVVRDTPGHTRGHVVFDDANDALVFTGDHLLPRITPSIAFERAPEPLPLRSYINSLRLFLDLPDSRMLPAHGDTDHRARSRAAELLEHHRQRLEHVGELVAGGAVTALEVAARMRWTRAKRRLGDLNVVHRMTAVLEVASHLDLLVAEHLLTVTHVDGVNAFELAAGEDPAVAPADNCWARRNFWTLPVGVVGKSSGR